MIAVDLSREQALHVDPKAVQKINFTENQELFSKYFETF